MKNTALDVSEHDGPLPYMEFIPGLNDPGEITLELWHDPADPTQSGVVFGLLETYDDAALRNYQIVFSDVGATIFQFSGIITNYESAAAVDDALSVTVTIKLTGQPVFDA